MNSTNKIHFGIGTQYFISDTKSFTFRVKYFKNGIDYYKEGNPCSSFFCLFSSSSKRFLYEGSVLKIPINYQWEKVFILPKLKFLFTSGLALNLTIEEKYIEIDRIIPDFNKVNLNFNIGIGFLYKINKDFDLFAVAEKYSGTTKSEKKIGFPLGSRLRTDESLINIGIRYKLK